MKDVAIEARDDATRAGQVVVRLHTAEPIDAGARYRLRLVDLAAGDTRWPDTEHQAVLVTPLADGVEVTIGADVAAHPLLTPGTAVLVEVNGLRGEFLWPAVTPVQLYKRKRVALRIVAPVPVPVVVETVAAIDHAPAAAALEFDRASQALAQSAQADVPDSRLSAPAPVAPVLSTYLFQPAELKPIPVIIAQTIPLRLEPQSPPAIPKDDVIPSIFTTDEWPDARVVLATPVPPTPVPRVTDAGAARPVADVFPTAEAVAPKIAAPPQPRPDVLSPAESGDVAHGSEPQAFRTALARLRSTLDSLPPLAAAGFGFAVLTAAAGSMLLWPAARSGGNSGVAFQDQRRWQDGQMQKPVRVAAPIASPTAATPPTPPPPPPPATSEASTKPETQPSPAAPVPLPRPPVVAVSATAPAACGAAEVRTVALPAGVMSISIRSACHRQQAVQLIYGGLEFKRRFDIDGGLDVTIDCIFGASTPVAVKFADGKTTDVQPACLDLDRVSKLALVWRQPIDLDLQVFEKPATPGSGGQIARARPGARDTARELAASERSVRGFLSSIASAKSDDGDDDPRMTVYTAFLPPQGAIQSVPFAVDFATRGDTAAGEMCTGGRYAGPAYEIVRLNTRGQVTREEGQLAAFACGANVASTLRFNQSLHAPFRIRN